MEVVVVSIFFPSMAEKSGWEKKNKNRRKRENGKKSRISGIIIFNLLKLIY